MNPEAVVLICSRPESRRIPFKAFYPINGKLALAHCVDRCKQTSLPVVLCIPHDLPADLEQEYRKIHSEIYHGNAESPLHRMAGALDYIKRYAGWTPRYVVRVTGDDILIDAATVTDLVKAAMDGSAGYAFTPGIIEGAGVEVIDVENLKTAAALIDEPVEFVSYAVRGEKIPNGMMLLQNPRQSVMRPYRLCLDYPEDAVVLEAVMRAVGNDAPLDKIASFLDNNPHVLDYNRLPLVSVYTCAYNADRWIDSTIRSVLRNYHDIEYIVVDDASTDGTLTKILDAAGHRARILVNAKNLGLASSSNRALNEARGKYVIRVDADDVLLPGAIERMLSVMKTEAPPIVYPNYHVMDEDGQTLAENMEGIVQNHPGCALMDKRMLNELRFTEGLRHYDGLDLYTRMQRRFPRPGPFYLQEPLWLYRRRPKSLSQSEPSVREEIRRRITGE